MMLFTPDGKLIGIIGCPPPPPKTWIIWDFVLGIGAALIAAMVVVV